MNNKTEPIAPAGNSKPMSYEKERRAAIMAMAPRAALEQLAEESTELAQAALKLIRAGWQESPTPVSIEDASAHLVEEAGDVLMMLDFLQLADVDTSGNPKWARLAERLAQRKTAQNERRNHE